MSNYLIKTITYRLYPNQVMKKVLDHNCDYRRFCWNQALGLWNDLYDAHTVFDQIDQIVFVPKQNKNNDKWHIIKQEKHKNPLPNWRLVRNLLVENKADWQYEYSARILQLAVQDLGKAWQSFFNKAQKDWGKPRFKSKSASSQGFKSDRSLIVNNQVILDKPRNIKTDWSGINISEKPLPYPTGVMSFYRLNNKYFVSIPYKIPKQNIRFKSKTHKATGVDVNVGHLNYLDGRQNALPKSLKHIYQKIKHYQRVLAKKRVVNGRINGTKSKKYRETKAKLQASYQRATNIQHDLMHKFTTKLVDNYDQIVIEDLDVKQMMMFHVASKGMQRSMFGLFRQYLTYKCDWYGKKLILADKLYPSTQRCAACGKVKKGNEKITLLGNKEHGTRHNEYVCYNSKCPNYLKKVDRDENAMLNLTFLAGHPELNKPL